MSSMVERAAVAIFDVRERRYPMNSNEEAARAALLAALDPEDEALVEALARSISLVGRDWDTPFDFDSAPDYAKDMQRDIARTAILAIKAAAQGERGLSRASGPRDGVEHPSAQRPAEESPEAGSDPAKGERQE